jgi:ribonuclease D
MKNSNLRSADQELIDRLSDASSRRAALPEKWERTLAIREQCMRGQNATLHALAAIREREAKRESGNRNADLAPAHDAWPAAIDLPSEKSRRPFIGSREIAA